MYDVVIIGAGITGTMLCRKLSQYRLKLAVLEKANDIAEGATMANSAVIHVGYDPEDGTNSMSKVSCNMNRSARICIAHARSSAHISPPAVRKRKPRSMC